MITSIFRGNKYRFCKSPKGNYWIGANDIGTRVRGGGTLYPGNNCVAPLCIWGELQDIAVESGFSREEFITVKPKEEPKKKARRSKTAKVSDPNVISIF